MSLLNRDDFGPAVAVLLPPDHLNELGPGVPNEAVRQALEALAVAPACKAGLWLLHDFFDESHAISQDLTTAEGSYWHGILHRREPDDDNAKYWFRRVGQHAVFPALLSAAQDLTAGQPGSEPLQPLVQASHWNASLFVDLCSAARRHPSATTLLCQKIQQAEWELLFQQSWNRG